VGQVVDVVGGCCCTGAGWAGSGIPNGARVDGCWGYWGVVQPVELKSWADARECDGVMGGLGSSRLRRSSAMNVVFRRPAISGRPRPRGTRRRPRFGPPELSPNLRSPWLRRAVGRPETAVRVSADWPIGHGGLLGHGVGTAPNAAGNAASSQDNERHSRAGQQESLRISERSGGPGSQPSQLCCTTRREFVTKPSQLNYSWADTETAPDAAMANWPIGHRNVRRQNQALLALARKCSILA
jgi:hypothetical protein